MNKSKKKNNLNKICRRKTTLDYIYFVSKTNLGEGQIYCFHAVRTSSSSVTKVCALNSSFIIDRNLKLFGILAYQHMEHRIFFAGSFAIFEGVIAPFLFEKCNKIYISLNISETYGDLALKLRIWLYHHKISSYTKFYNSDF